MIQISINKNVVVTDTKVYRVKYKNNKFVVNGMPISNAEPLPDTPYIVWSTPVNDKYTEPTPINCTQVVRLALPYWSLVYEFMKVQGYTSNGKFVITKKLYNNEWVNINHCE